MTSFSGTSAHNEKIYGSVYYLPSLGNSVIEN